MCKVSHSCRSKSVFSALKLLSLIAAIEDLVYGVSGAICSDAICSDAIYEHFLLMNKFRLSFKDLCLVENVYQNIDWNDRLEG